MSVEKNKESVRRLYEAINKADFSHLEEFFAPDYVNRTMPNVKGVEGVRQLFAGWLDAFPDARTVVDHIIGEGDFVMVTTTMTGTFKGKYGGFEPNGRKLTRTAAVLVRLRDGKQVEAWNYGDSLSFYRQLGLPVPD